MVIRDVLIEINDFIEGFEHVRIRGFKQQHRLSVYIIGVYI